MNDRVPEVRPRRSFDTNTIVFVIKQDYEFFLSVFDSSCCVVCTSCA